MPISIEIKKFINLVSLCDKIRKIIILKKLIFYSKSL